MSHPSRRYFEDPHRYLSNSAYIALRSHLVAEISPSLVVAEVCDVGCGDGRMSTRFLDGESNRVLFLDVSHKMIRLAKNRVLTGVNAEPDALFVTGGIDCIDEAKAFDYVLVLGVLAHVQDPLRLLKQVMSHVNHRGFLLVQYTDYGTALGRVHWWYRKAQETLLRRRGYVESRVSRADVMMLASQNGLHLVDEFRYQVLLPGVDRFLSQSKLLNLEVRSVQSGLAQRIGRERMLLFQR